jgi:UDP-glucose 4-epimerase
MHYLITGGAGFIGSHLSDALLGEGHSVTVLDDLSTGSIRNIAHLREHPRFHYVIDTMLNAPLLAELVDEADAVFHLAAAVGVKLIVESPVRTIETNVRCTELLLSVAVKKRKKVLLTSTSEVYGKNVNVPFTEESDLVMGATTRGRWSYACSKAIDEFLAIAYWREKRLPTVVVRLFNTVGPRQTGQYGMVIPRFVSQALAGDPLTVYGDGTNSRCFAHVKDAVRALTRLMETDVAVGEVFNIGNNHEISILDLAYKIIEMTGSSSEISFVPYEIAYEESFEDMPRRVPCLEKIERTIGWRPEADLEEIISSVVEFQQRDTPRLVEL